MQLTVPGISSDGRVRLAPWRDMYPISPLNPARSHSRKWASSAGRSMAAMPSPVKPSSAAHARSDESRFAGAGGAGSSEAVICARIINRCPKRALSFDLPDSGATESLGKALAKAFPGAGAGAGAGAIVHLRGELGSGKTTCARSLLHALGVTAPVRSPTYTLVDTYSVADLICVHVDLVSSADDHRSRGTWTARYDRPWVSHVDRMAREGRGCRTAGRPPSATCLPGRCSLSCLGRGE